MPSKYAFCVRVNPRFESPRREDFGNWYVKRINKMCEETVNKQAEEEEASLILDIHLNSAQLCVLNEIRLYLHVSRRPNVRLFSTSCLCSVLLRHCSHS